MPDNTSGAINETKRQDQQLALYPDLILACKTALSDLQFFYARATPLDGAGRLTAVAELEFVLARAKEIK